MATNASTQVNNITIIIHINIQYYACPHVGAVGHGPPAPSVDATYAVSTNSHTDVAVARSVVTAPSQDPVLQERSLEDIGSQFGQVADEQPAELDL